MPKAKKTLFTQTLNLTLSQMSCVSWCCQSPFGAKIKNLTREYEIHGSGRITGTRDALEDLHELVLNSAYNAGFNIDSLSNKLGKAIDKLWELEDAEAVAKLAEIDRKDAERRAKARKARATKKAS